MCSWPWCCISARRACFRRGAAEMADAGRRRRHWPGQLLPGLILLAFALLPLVAATGVERYMLDLATRMMIFAIAALALDLLVGFGGLVSFGHAAFIGLGAYAVGILASHGINDALVALPAALIVSTLFA